MMNRVLFFCFVFLFVTNCSSGDDNDNDDPKTNHELLISGKWYFESHTGSNYTSCEKKSYFDFEDEDSVTVRPYGYNTGGNCESFGTLSGDYSLTNDTEITMQIPGYFSSASIVSIISSKLVLQTGGETIILDRTPE